MIKKTTEGKKTKYDVRFFGPPYERSIIEEAFIKPIDTPVSKLSLKRSGKLSHAQAEANKHLELINQSFGAEITSPAKTTSVSAGPPKKRLKVIIENLIIIEEDLISIIFHFQTSKKQTSSKKEVVNMEVGC